MSTTVIALITSGGAVIAALVLGFLYARARYALAKEEIRADKAIGEKNHYMDRVVILKQKLLTIQKELADVKKKYRESMSSGELVEHFNERMRQD